MGASWRRRFPLLLQMSGIAIVAHSSGYMRRRSPGVDKAAVVVEVESKEESAFRRAPPPGSFPTAMFSSSVQPGLVSLFSSTGSEPLGLFESHTDNALPSDSLICLLNDATSQPPPPPPRTLIAATGMEDDTTPSPNYTLAQTVLHIQSPTIRTTYIRCPPASPAASARAPASSVHLGLKHPWIHLQARNMGREWAFEIGVVDQSGREGIVRCSTFQVRYFTS